MRFAPFALPLALISAVAAAPKIARADVASRQPDGRFALYFNEGDATYRAGCPAGTAHFDRDLCDDGVVRADTAVAAALFRARLGERLEADERDVAQIWAQIQALKDKVSEILNSPASPEPQVTDAALDAAERRLLDARAGMQDARDQVARLRLALAENPHDDEVRVQLEATRAALAVEQAAESARLGELAALRLAYVLERGSSHTQDFADLLALWRARDEALALARKRVDDGLADMTRGERLLARLDDRAFVWPIDADPTGAAARFEQAFVEAEVARRTVVVAAQARDRLAFVVSDARPVDTVICRTSTPTVVGAGVAFRFRRVAAGGTAADVEVPIPWVRAGTLEVDFRKAYVTADPLLAHGFLGRPAAGAWEISYHLRSAPAGPTPEPFEALSCRLVFAR